MKLKFTRRIVPLLILFFVLLAATGCVVYKNPASSIPPPAITRQWQVRYPLRICVRNPQETDFDCIPNEDERKWNLEQAVMEAERLVKILNGCHLFNDVTLSDAGSTSCDLTIKALPRVFERTDYDDPWLLLYGGIFPLYIKNNMAVNFKFLEGMSGDFNFNWTEEVVIGFWAPVVDVAGKNWQFDHSSSTYWNDLRSTLIERFDKIHK